VPSWRCQYGSWFWGTAQRLGLAGLSHCPRPRPCWPKSRSRLCQSSRCERFRSMSRTFDSTRNSSPVRAALEQVARLVGGQVDAQRQHLPRRPGTPRCRQPPTPAQRPGATAGQPRLAFHGCRHPSVGGSFTLPSLSLNSIEPEERQVGTHGADLWKPGGSAIPKASAGTLAVVPGAQSSQSARSNPGDNPYDAGLAPPSQTPHTHLGLVGRRGSSSGPHT
jgi:hypothetical protein